MTANQIAVAVMIVIAIGVDPTRRWVRNNEKLAGFLYLIGTALAVYATVHAV